MGAFFIGGLDIGGTKIAATIAGPDGPLARITQPTVKSGPLRALGDQALALLNAACAKAGVDRGRVTALGVSSCGPFARTDGKLGLAAPNICGGRAGRDDLPNDWDIVPLEAILREQFDKIVIENDCIAALVGERNFGAARGVSDCVYVTWSTGIGFGLCVDGRILHGKNGNAGHAGHMLMNIQSDAICGCGNRGDLEALISGRWLGQSSGMATPDLFAAARAGEPSPKAIAIEAAQWFGRGLYNVAVALDAQLFVIGGSVWEHHGDWLAPIVRAEIETRLPILTDGVMLVPAALGKLATDIGALSLVLSPDWLQRWQDANPWQVLSTADA